MLTINQLQFIINFMKTNNIEYFGTLINLYGDFQLDENAVFGLDINGIINAIDLTKIS